MKLFISLSAPHEWAILNSKGQVQDSGDVSDLENYRVPKYIEQVTGVAPGDTIACHTVSIPGKRKAHIEAALPYALEERLTDDVEQLHFRLLNWSLDEASSAVVTSKAQLDSWIKHFRGYGINLDAIIPEYFLLPTHPKTEITISPGEDGQFRIRTDPYQGLLLDQDGFDYWWNSLNRGGITVSVTDHDCAKRLNKLSEDTESGDSDVTTEINYWNIGSGFSQWIANNSALKDIQAFNILDGDFRPSHNKKNLNLLKISGVLTVLSCIAYWGVLSVQAYWLERKYNQTNHDMRSLFATYFPNEPYLDRPRSQVTSLIEQARSGGKSTSEFQLLLNAVSEITPRFNASIDEINYRDEVMVISCVVKDLASLDTIKQGFLQLGSFNVELLSSGARDGKVSGRFQLSRGA